jgi:transposase
MQKKIEIAKTLEFKRNEHLKAKGELKNNRLKVLIYIKEGKYHFQSDIAKKLGRTEKTVRQWIQEYTQSGLSSHLKVSIGGSISKKALGLIRKFFSN